MQHLSLGVLCSQATVAEVMRLTDRRGWIHIGAVRASPRLAVGESAVKCQSSSERTHSCIRS